MAANSRNNRGNRDGGNRSKRNNNVGPFNDAASANDNGSENGQRPMTRAQIIEALRARLPALNDTLKMGDEILTPTKNQRKIMSLIDCKDVVFVSGPQGSGKTVWPIYKALEGLVSGKYNKFSITAPVVEADEQLGFLKGDKNEKMLPHVLQHLETIEDLVGKTLREQLVASEIVEIAPHAFNRGRTYKKTLYLLDESQNASGRQLQTALGRLGIGSTFVFAGDDVQNDRTAGQSAFVKFIARYTQEVYRDRTGHVEMNASDVSRHPLLKLIVERGDDRPLDGFEDRNDSKIGAKKRAPSFQPK